MLPVTGKSLMQSRLFSFKGSSHINAHHLQHCVEKGLQLMFGLKRFTYLTPCACEKPVSMTFN